MNLSHCDLDLWSKVTNFNRVWASVLNNRLAKTASKSVHSFGWKIVYKQSRADTQTDRQSDTQKNCIDYNYDVSLHKYL